MIAEKDFWLHISMTAKNLIVFLMTLYVSGIEIRSTVCQEAELSGYQRMDLAGTTRNLSARMPFVLCSPSRGKALRHR